MESEFSNTLRHLLKRRTAPKGKGCDEDSLSSLEPRYIVWFQQQPQWQLGEMVTNVESQVLFQTR